MNFFKSVFSEDDSLTSNDQPENENPEPDPSSWTFSSLIKTLATTSESMIGSYRQDFQELGSGLKNETTAIRQVASRAVKELPHSFEIGASVAQESLESVGQAIDDIGDLVWNSTSKIITHGREALLLSAGQYDSDSSSVSNSTKRSNSSGRYSDNQISDAKRYSRFEMQVRAMQCDVGTYCTQPEDSDVYDKWRLGFTVEDKSGEIDALVRENGVIKNIFNEVVPSKVEYETFWSRYFYNLHKLKQAEDVMAKLVRRAMAEEEEEEELSWDCDDDDDDDEEEQASSSKSDLTQNLDEIENTKAENMEEKDDEKVESRESSCKDSDISVVSTQPSLLPEGEDLEWDEIEDLGSNDDESKAVGSSNGVKLLKTPVTVAVVEDDEDLSWDIEEDNDDDHELPAKP